MDTLPSGIKNGNLKKWIKKMNKLCPNPKIGDIVIVSKEKGRKIGYRVLAVSPKKIWQRVVCNY
jgi:hypothetical protein